MSIASRLRNYLLSLAADVIITSKELVQLLGSRNAVDIALHRLFKKNKIKRHANGVYTVVEIEGEAASPSAKEIAEAKARAYGKIVISESKQPEQNAYTRDANTFWTDGARTTFKSDRGPIQFKIGQFEQA